MKKRGKGKKLTQNEINQDVERLLGKQIQRVRRDIEKCLTEEQLKHSSWVVYGKNEYRADESEKFFGGAVGGGMSDTSLTYESK
jgi:hypothetical protein